MSSANVKLDLIDRDQMPHIFPLLPLMKESKEAIKKIVEIINQL